MPMPTAIKKRNKRRPREGARGGSSSPLGLIGRGRISVARVGSQLSEWSAAGYWVVVVITYLPFASFAPLATAMCTNFGDVGEQVGPLGATSTRVGRQGVRRVG